MKKVLLITLSALSLTAFAGEKKKEHHKDHKEHKEHLGAHEHGKATVNVVIDENKASVLLDGAGEGFLGFEGEAKTAKQKKAVQELKNINLSKSILFEDKLGCKLSASKVEIKSEEEGHSDVEISADATCNSAIAGTKIKIDLRSFKHLDEYKLELLGPKPVSKVVKNTVQTFEQ